MSDLKLPYFSFALLDTLKHSKDKESKIFIEFLLILISQEYYINVT